MRTLVIAAACAALLAVVVLVAARLRPRKPTIGLETGRLRDCPASPNCVVSEGGDAGHAIGPIRFGGTPEQAMDGLEAVLAALPRVRIVTREPAYLHAEFRSLLFGYVDDFEARIDEGARSIQVRSASRSGHSDLGVNRRRVESIRSALEKR